MVVAGNLTYTARDILKLSGTCPQSQLLMISLNDSSVTIFYGFSETNKVDGTWSGEFDLQLMPVSTGRAMISAGIIPALTDTNIPRPSVVFVISPVFFVILVMRSVTNHFTPSARAVGIPCPRRPGRGLAAGNAGERETLIN
jgi:hypothetical protein